ncbi:MAG TPA: hypothetical protein PLB41_16410, partial [Rubrivivax sp.]|nr:hypothetical protein [Rubrivivax sp.]
PGSDAERAFFLVAAARPPRADAASALRRRDRKVQPRALEQGKRSAKSPLGPIAWLKSWLRVE